MPHKKIILFSKVNKWLLYDDFSDERAVGTISGTYPKVGSRRVVTDSQGAMSLGSGKLIVKLSTGTTGDPSIWWGGFSRVPGRMYVFKDFAQTTSGSSRRTDMGLDNNQLTASHTMFRLDTNLLYCIEYGILSPSVGSYTNGNSYNSCLIDKGAQKGTFFFIKGNPEYPEWALIWNGYGTGTNLDSTLYPNSQFLGSGTLSSIRVPKETWLPSPIATDKFNRASGTLLQTESQGIEGQSAPIQSWYTGASGTWLINNNFGLNLPTLGIELNSNGGMESLTGFNNVSSLTSGSTEQVHGGTYSRKVTITGTGASAGVYYGASGINITPQTWVKQEGWIYVVTGSARMWDWSGQLAVSINVTPVITELGKWVYTSNTARMMTGSGISYMGSRSGGSGSVWFIDDFSTKVLSTPDLFNTINIGTLNFEMSTQLFIPNNVYLSGTFAQFGLVLCLDNPLNPQNYIIVYHDQAGTNAIRTEKFLGGVSTTLSSVASNAYVPYGRLKVIKNGTSLGVFHKDVFVVRVTLTDNILISGTYGGLFSTDERFQHKNFSVHALGTEGQYRYLDNFIK